MEGSHSSSSVMGAFKKGGSSTSSSLSDTAISAAPPPAIVHKPLIDLDSFTKMTPRAYSAAQSMELYEKIVCDIDSDDSDQGWSSSGLRILPIQFPMIGRWDGSIKDKNTNTQYSLNVVSLGADNTYQASHFIPSIMPKYTQCTMTMNSDRIRIEDGFSVLTGRLHSNSGVIKGTMVVKGEKRHFELVKEGGRKTEVEESKSAKPPKHPTFVPSPSPSSVDRKSSRK